MDVSGIVLLCNKLESVYVHIMKMNCEHLFFSECSIYLELYSTKFFILIFCKNCIYVLICTVRRENPIFCIPTYFWFIHS